MRCEVILMGFAVYSTDKVLEHSFGFDPDTINDLAYFNDPNYTWGGFVNTGAYTCQKRGVEEPYEQLSGHLTFQYSDFEGINKNLRLQQTQRLPGSRGGKVYPTVALVFASEGGTLMGMIVFPDSSWSSFKSEFVANLNFFLHPMDGNYAQVDPKFSRGCEPPRHSKIVAVDLSPLHRECAYQLQQREKQN